MERFVKLHVKHGVKYGLEEGKNPTLDFSEEFETVSKPDWASK